MSTDKITLRRPDDWHVHLRDGAMMEAVLPWTARAFGRAIVMPNLVPPVTTADMAAGYRRRILAALDDASAERGFTPLMTAYLTDVTDPDDLAQGFEDGVFAAAKLYPAGATTNSAAGVTDIAKLDRVLARMEAIGLPLLIHGEVTDQSVDIFDREAVFIERILTPMRRRFAHLNIVFEHATTRDAVDFVRAHRSAHGHNHTACTITVHHLMISRNAIFQGGLRPHLYCLPVAKRATHTEALRRAATSGEACFFLGTDTAPHPVHRKEAECCAAGIFSAPAALELYAQVFEEEGALDRLEAFASLNGPRFYGMEPNEARVTLVREPWKVPESVAVVGGEKVRPFLAGETINWKLEESA